MVLVGVFRVRPNHLEWILTDTYIETLPYKYRCCWVNNTNINFWRCGLTTCWVFCPPTCLAISQFQLVLNYGIPWERYPHRVGTVYTASLLFLGWSTVNIPRTAVILRKISIITFSRSACIPRKVTIARTIAITVPSLGRPPSLEQSPFLWQTLLLGWSSS